MIGQLRGSGLDAVSYGKDIHASRPQKRGFRVLSQAIGRRQTPWRPRRRCVTTRPDGDRKLSMATSMHSGLRLLIYDRSCRGKALRPGLSHAWLAGSWLYRVQRRIDASFGAQNWAEALRWLITFEQETPIAEVQFWGHGKWGCALIDGQRLDRQATQKTHTLYPPLRELHARLIGPQALFWFRTCETFGAKIGHDFCQAFSGLLGCRVAGHTYIIAYYQSGLHALAPGERPNWSPTEGLARGSADDPQQALWSHRKAPNTITCLTGHLPRAMLLECNRSAG